MIKKKLPYQGSLKLNSFAYLGTVSVTVAVVSVITVVSDGVLITVSVAVTVVSVAVSVPSPVVLLLHDVIARPAIIAKVNAIFFIILLFLLL